MSSPKARLMALRQSEASVIAGFLSVTLWNDFWVYLHLGIKLCHIRDWSFVYNYKLKSAGSLTAKSYFIKPLMFIAGVCICLLAHSREKKIPCCSPSLAGLKQKRNLPLPFQITDQSPAVDYEIVNLNSLRNHSMWGTERERNIY